VVRTSDFEVGDSGLECFYCYFELQTHIIHPVLLQIAIWPHTRCTPVFRDSDWTCVLGDKTSYKKRFFI